MIIVTRPSPYGEALTQLCNDAGLPAIHYPFFRIEPGKDLPQLQKTLNQLSDNDSVVIVSPQVIRLLNQLATAIHFPNKLRYFAVGKTTAMQFTAMTQQDVIYPTEREDSEGLIELIEHQQIPIAGTNVVILCGDHGRDLLKEYFKQHNASVERCYCYQRATIQHDTPLYTPDMTPPYIIVVTSVGHLMQLEQYSTLEHKQKCHLVTSHPRIAEQAKSLGWQSITVSINANNQNLFKTIETLCHNA